MFVTCTTYALVCANICNGKWQTYVLHKCNKWQTYVTHMCDTQTNICVTYNKHRCDISVTYVIHMRQHMRGISQHIKVPHKHKAVTIWRLTQLFSTTQSVQWQSKQVDEATHCAMRSNSVCSFTPWAPIPRTKCPTKPLSL